MINSFEPLTTGTSDLPTLYNKFKAFRVVFYNEVFPGEVDIPIRLIRECLAANTIAKASSKPGSQSSQIVYVDIKNKLNYKNHLLA